VVYQEVNQFNDDVNLYSEHKKVTVSYDEKPGIQAIAGIAKDLPPEPGKYRSWGRDYEYRRLGTLSLLAGIDLHDGFILSIIIRERHRSNLPNFCKPYTNTMTRLGKYGLFLIIILLMYQRKPCNG